MTAEPAPVLREAPAWVGRWSSASCGERTYGRNLELKADGSVAIEERISPCPEGARCITSGIWPVSGTWTATGQVATLTLAPPDGPRFVELPTTLDWNGGVVQGDCAYEAGWLE